MSEEEEEEEGMSEEAAAAASREEEEEKKGEAAWELLSEDVQERILSRLPVSAAIRAAAVSRRWRAQIAAPGFAAAQREAQGRRPWLCVWGINELIHARSEVYAYDPGSGEWFRVRPERPPDFNRASLAGSQGLFYAFGGGGAVCYAAGRPTAMAWRKTAPSAGGATRSHALVGMVAASDVASDAASDVAAPGGGGFTLVVVGGVLDDGGDPRSAEMYAPGPRSWSACPPLPASGFRDSASCHLMSSAVVGRRMFVADHHGALAAFDAAANAWSRVRRLRLLPPPAAAPPAGCERVAGLVSVFALACAGRLHVAAVCRATRSHPECLRLFLVEDDLDLDPDPDPDPDPDLDLDLEVPAREVSVMPPHLFARFASDEHSCSSKQASLRCVGSGHCFYVYSECVYSGYPACACDVAADGSYSWKLLPPLPSPVPRFDRVVCASMDVAPAAFLDARRFA